MPPIPCTQQLNTPIRNPAQPSGISNPLTGRIIGLSSDREKYNYVLHVYRGIIFNRFPIFSYRIHPQRLLHLFSTKPPFTKFIFGN
jgi:hypothetical protein